MELSCGAGEKKYGPAGAGGWTVPAFTGGTATIDPQ
jgi:hypothetical protein